MGRLWEAAAIGLLVLGAAALVLRDRVPLLAALSYLPVPLVTGVGFFILLLRSRSGAGRLLAAGLLLTAGVLEMSGLSPPPRPYEGRSLRVVQQNVWWGGGRQRSQPLWHALERDLVALRPDVLVLAELPETSWREGMGSRLFAATGRAWTITCAQGRPEDPNIYRVAVVSPYPHHSVEVRALDQGLLLDVTLELPESSLRVWAVDGLSHVSRDRRRMLGDLTERLAEADATGRSVDLLAGDFNAPAKSVGFDALRANYWLAGEHSLSWRATWPSFLPLVDVDHVWLRRLRFGATQARFRTDPRLDHRGQIVDGIWRPEVRVSAAPRPEIAAHGGVRCRAPD